MTASPDRDELLQQLLSLPPIERDEFLRGQCGSNEHLREEMRSLLRVHDAYAGRLRLEQSDSLPGSIGRYPVLRVLGRGGMGTVYLGLDPELERKIAIKVVSRELTSHLSTERLRQEARLLASVSHPNLATVYSLETAGDWTFLTLELVTGPTLGASFHGGPLPVREALLLFRQIASAIAVIHRRRIVHCDLSPGNICISDDGLVKVLDFGLSTLVFDSGELRSTDLRSERPISNPNQMLGTPGYMSPELIRGERADHRTDSWSFGCLLFEALTGTRAFPGDDIADVLVNTMEEEPDYSSLPPDLPAEVRQLLEHCLQKAPSQRHDSMERVFSILERSLPAALGAAAVLAQEAPEDELASIAVLPFVNRSPDPEDEYFSDGLADELLNVLAKIRGLRVAARTSSFHWKGKDTTLGEIGRTLKVATVLEGSMRKAGNRVRIAVQLVKVSDGFQLWSERYDRTLDDVFAVQDDIAQSVVKELRTTLLGERANANSSNETRAEVAAAVRGRGHDPEAHRLYLQARYFADRHNLEDMLKAVEYLEAAIAREPGHVLALAKLAHVYATEASSGWLPVAEGFERARRAAEQALELDPDLAQAHAVLSRIQSTYDFDFKGAEASCRRAIELAPGNPEVLLFATVWPLYASRAQEAITACQLALEKDPLSSALYVRLGIVLRAADRLDEALGAFRKALELSPHRAGTHMICSLVHVAQGRPEKALLEAELEPITWARLSALAVAYHALCRLAESDAALGELVDTFSEECAYQIAGVHACRGSIDDAFHWLEKAYENRDAGIASLMPEPAFRPLHGDPRWERLLRKLGLLD